MPVTADVLYVSDEDGRLVAVIVPIGLWRDIAVERETAYLMRSGPMSCRLLEAKGRLGGMPLADVCLRLGL